MAVARFVRSNKIKLQSPELRFSFVGLCWLVGVYVGWLVFVVFGFRLEILCAGKGKGVERGWQTTTGGQKIVTWG